MAIDETKLNEFMGHAVGDIGAALSAALVVVGDKLGLYKALANGAATPAELAKRTGTVERYVREWLNNQAAGGYVTYDPASGRYSMTEEQQLALAQEGSPAFIPGAFQVIAACFASRDRVTVFRVTIPAFRAVRAYRSVSRRSVHVNDLSWTKT